MKTSQAAVSPPSGDDLDFEVLRRQWDEQWGDRPVYDLVSQLAPDLAEAADAVPGGPVPLPESEWGDETVGDALRAFIEAAKGFITHDDEARFAHGMSPILEDGGVLAAQMAPAVVGGLRAFDRSERARDASPQFGKKLIGEMIAGFEAAYRVQHGGTRTRSDRRAMRRGLREFIESYPHLWY